MSQRGWTLNIFRVGVVMAVAAVLAPAAVLGCPAMIPHRELPNVRTLARFAPVSIPVDQMVQAEGGFAPEVVGRWGEMMTWPLTGISAVLMPTGKVMVFSYPDQQPGGSAALLWDPSTHETSRIDVDRDVFCSGVSVLPDGQVYMTGGNDLGCPFQGTHDTHVFDPWTEGWSRLDDMSVARWYPTNTALADGRVIITSGLDRECRLTSVMEMYTPGVGLEVIEEGERLLRLYPRLHLLSSGWIAGVGIDAQTWAFNPYDPEWRKIATTVSPINRWAGSSVQVPGEPDSILILGGDVPAMQSVERIDFAAPEPQWRDVAPMYFPRSHFNPVQLPDRTVLIVGGGGDQLYEGPVLNAELYDPAADTWTLLPAQQHPRMYHSTALLLPDGRVLSAGQDHGVSTYTAEIYEPAYLHRGARPVVEGVPDFVAYGDVVTLQVDSPRTIASAALMAPSAVTHGVNMTQRFVDLPVNSLGGGTVDVQMPVSGHVAPSGYYMLFVVDDDGVPSVGQFVRLVFPTKGTEDQP